MPLYGLFASLEPDDLGLEQPARMLTTMWPSTTMLEIVHGELATDARFPNHDSPNHDAVDHRQRDHGRTSNLNPLRRRSVFKSSWLVVLCAIWLMLVVAGLGFLWQYSSRPGEQGYVVPSWPVESRLSAPNDHPSLLVFCHPKCACTRATLGELGKVAVRCGDRFKCQVVFIQPNGTSEEWTATDCWRLAEAIPGIEVGRDEQGREARMFGVRTSGHVLIYDRRGRLVFSGGITASRGHPGENAGRTLVQSLLLEETKEWQPEFIPPPAELGASGELITPVFGCPLFASTLPPVASSLSRQPSARVSVED